MARTSLKHISNKQLISELKGRRARLLEEMEEMDELLSGSTVTVSKPAAKGKGKLSEAERKPLAIGQWNRRYNDAQKAGDKSKMKEYAEKLRKAGAGVPRAKAPRKAKAKPTAAPAAS